MFVLLVAGLVAVGWAQRWPPAIFGRPVTAKPPLAAFPLGAASPLHRLADGAYTNDPAAWARLGRRRQAMMLATLHRQERRFSALKDRVFPKRQLLTVHRLKAGATLAGGRSSTARLIAAINGSATRDYGATDFGDRSLAFGNAQYSGNTGSNLWGWMPCVDDTGAPAPLTSSAFEICGGWGVGNTDASQGMGMTQTSLAVSGFMAAQATQPVSVVYTTSATRASRVTVTGTIETVSMSMGLGAVGASCTPGELVYVTPAFGALSGQPSAGSWMKELGGCLPSLNASVDGANLAAPIDDAAKVFTTIADSYSGLKGVIHSGGNPAVVICSAAQEAGDFAGLVTDLAGLGSPSCTPTVLPTWSGSVSRGQTLEFTVAPLTEALVNGLAVQWSSLYSFVNLSITECDEGSACSTTTTTTTTTTLPGPTATTAPTTSIPVVQPKFLECVYEPPQSSPPPNGPPTVRPSFIALPCGVEFATENGYLIKGLSWTSWGPTSATATGIYQVNSCTPDCADSNYLTYPVDVTLTVPSEVDGTDVFTVLDIHFTGALPSSLNAPSSWGTTRKQDPSDYILSLPGTCTPTPSGSAAGGC